ncbi:Na+/H+-dicarboxylate symporter [Marinilactibacillus piezotolerans]|uniref:Na+/H+-dicarboxylate symporter n=1 Tax=Marinilactibacillus piezotolerans TaxID=258723 RepID=A0A1I3YTB7_9LACT|nr:dicarboxylate/amino acid:cation symporter [Marinilactibacillus piezotolerans]SFK35092.1 Na+/H+-dicarboxylate symporter [Marinilactibacillus piezotolerans]
MEKKKVKLGLVPKLLLAIILGVIVGQLSFIPTTLLRIPVTFSNLFSSLLSFIIPLMIIGFIVKGISDLTEGAGKLLGAATVISYASTIIGGIVAYFVASTVFPLFITSQINTDVQEASTELTTLFEIPLEPMLDVTAAIAFSFIMGMSISWLRAKHKSDALYNVFNEFNLIIVKVLNTAIIPLLPFFIFGNFVSLSYTGQVFDILSVFWRVFLIIIALHLILIVLWFTFAGLYRKKNPIQLIKNQIPGYFTAIGTQSSAATIPINIECAQKNGVSRKIREFMIPLCATIHLLGSMVTIISCVYAVLYLYDMPVNFGMMASFIGTLGIAMVAAPGAPGGAIMSALPFLTIVGIDPTGTLGNLLITLYLTQDSFGTAANVSCDNAITLVVEKIYFKYIAKEEASESLGRVQEITVE